MPIQNELDDLHIHKDDPVRLVARLFDKALQERHIVSLLLIGTAALALGAGGGAYVTYRTVRKDASATVATQQPATVNDEYQRAIIPKVPDGEIMVRDGSIQAFQVSKGEWTMADAGTYLVLLHAKPKSPAPPQANAEKTEPTGQKTTQ